MARITDQKRSKKPHRLEYITKNTKKYRRENPEKYKAHMIINNYYRYHKDERPNVCSNCGAKGYIELHHEDYNKPREIIALCPLCHKQHHEGKIVIDLTKKIII